MRKGFAFPLVIGAVVLISLIGLLFWKFSVDVKTPNLSRDVIPTEASPSVTSDQLPPNSKIPPHIVEWANSHIIDLVGDDYFKTNYKFDLQQTLRPTTSSMIKPNGEFFGWYYISYNYFPLSQLAGQPMFISVPIHSDVKSFEAFKKGLSTDKGVQESWVACYNGKEFCTFKVSRKQATEIVKGLNVPELSSIKESDLSVELPQKQTNEAINWTVSYSRKTGSDCSQGYKVSINIETGQSSSAAGRTACI